MSNQTLSANKIKAEFELIKRRQVALRIAMALFDNINAMEIFSQVATLLGDSSNTPSVEMVDSIIIELRQIANRHGVPLPDEH